jgi:hypothetical protein
MKSNKSKMIVLVVCIFIFGGYLFYNYTTTSKYDENVKSVDWLPEVATNISYFKSYLFIAYEFTISENDFLALAEKEGWKIEQIEKLFEISRYTSGENPEGAETEAIITSGYFYEQRETDGGGISVAFDADKQRAYFQSNLR